MSKVLVIVSTAEKEKALTGILYAANALKYQWVDELKVFFFGPFEKLVAEDEEVQEKVSRLMKYETPRACRFISDNDQLTLALEAKGYQVDYIGQAISEHIAQGFVPLVF